MAVLMQDRRDGWNDRCHPLVWTKTQERDPISEGTLLLGYYIASGMPNRFPMSMRTAASRG